MDTLHAMNAQFAINALNESLGAALPEIAGASLQAPSFFATFHHVLHTYGVWGGMASLAWVMRTSVQRAQHTQVNWVDKAGQRLVLALWTPKILVCPLSC
jgi:hypothetical protein